MSDKGNIKMLYSVKYAEPNLKFYLFYGCNYVNLCIHMFKDQNGT